MYYIYWFGIAIILVFVLYVLVYSFIRYLDYVIEMEND